MTYPPSVVLPFFNCWENEAQQQHAKNVRRHELYLQRGGAEKARQKRALVRPLLRLILSYPITVYVTLNLALTLTLTLT
jgi:hypothetical protein